MFAPRKEFLSSALLFVSRDCMKVGEVDSRKIGCTVSLLVSDLSPFPLCGLAFGVFPRNTMFCLVSVHNVFLSGCFLEESRQISK